MILKPNFKVAGPVFGPKIKELTNYLNGLSMEDINTLRNGDSLNATIDGDNYEITSEMADIRISAKEGFNVAMDNNKFVILNTELTDELIEEGIAREFISKIQNMRKTKDYNIVDRITIFYNGDSDVDATISNLKEFIMKETLATDIVKKDNLTESFDLNGHETVLDTEKNN